MAAITKEITTYQNGSPLLVEDIPTNYTIEGITQLIYGEGGTGKTDYLGSIGPRGLILSCGEGQMTLSSPGFIARRGNKIPKIMFLRERMNDQTGMFDKAEAWDKFTDVCDWFVTQDEYDTLAIDDATGLGMYARNKGMETNQDLGLGATMVKSNKAGFAVTEIQDYKMEVGIWIWFFLTHLPKFKERKKNFILAAHERHIYSKGQGIGSPSVLEKILPGFTGQVLPDQVQNYFDFVWRFEVSNGTAFRAQTVSNNKFLAKTRWGGVFPQEIKNPDFNSLVETLRSGNKYIPPK